MTALLVTASVGAVALGVYLLVSRGSAGDVVTVCRGCREVLTGPVPDSSGPGVVEWTLCRLCRELDWRRRHVRLGQRSDFTTPTAGAAAGERLARTVAAENGGQETRP